MNYVIEMPEGLVAPMGTYLPSLEAIQEACQVMDVTLELLDYPVDDDPEEDYFIIRVSDEITFHNDHTRIEARCCGDMVILYPATEPWGVSDLYDVLVMGFELKEYLDLNSRKCPCCGHIE